jgi:hypothetical protein
MLYSDFDWTLLDSPHFKEDSVREELIVPLLQALGYTASGAHKIHRSRSLKHPFVYLGSKSHRIEIIPDYLFEIGGKMRWVLDAKAPLENTVEGKNAQQAYSYAMHPEIRAQHFALCNGRYFTSFEVSRLRPTFHFPLKEIVSHWDKLAATLGPSAFDHVDTVMKPDLGLHLHRLGFSHFEKMHFLLIPIGSIGRVSDTHYTTGGGYYFGDEDYCASFDFHVSLLPQLLGCFDPALRESVADKMARFPFQVDLRAILPEVTIACKLGTRLETNADETEDFCPLEVIEFSR